jgi:tRNA pseudouridine38-40 synthase
MVLEYDGTNYCGWQAQKNGVAVQSVLEKCLAKILGKRAPVTASGRTDAGVHALGQVVNVKAAFPMDDKSLLMALNSMLPDDIAIKSVATVSSDFHAIKDALRKKYRYVILNSRVPSPLMARTSWRVPVALDVNRMKKSAAVLVGEHDFRSFMGPRSSIKSTVRNIISLSVKKRGEQILVDVTANGFLKYMVRRIVGTLVEAGKGKLAHDDIGRILDAADRTMAGPTAPAHGLCLVEVFYS